MNYIFRIVALSLALITCWGCDKDDDSSQEFVSTGKDNYIVSFAITVDGISYNASITDDRILVKVPYDISLKGAAASYTLSENATINPDPSALTDWNEEWQFIVTSGNKRNKVYHYSYEYAEISESGSVVLETQADVDNFKSRRINCIAGNLVVGADKGEDINNLDGLCNLEKVTNSVIIKKSYKGNDLSGMSSLREVGNFKLGTLDQLSTNETLETISLPALETVTGDFIIRQATIANIDLPALKEVGETFHIASEGLLAFAANKLTSVGSNLALIGTTDESGTSNSHSEVFVFPDLLSVGGNMTIRNFPDLASVDCSALQAVEGNVIFRDLALSGILLPKMTACRDVEVCNVPLYTFQAPELLQCGAVTFDNCANLGEVDMSAVTVIDGDLTLNNLEVLNNVEGLSSLTEVHGNLTISDVPLKDMAPLANLTSVTGMTVTNTNIETLDIRGCTFAGGALEIEKNGKLYSFLADDDFDGSVRINPNGSLIQVPEFSMTGFKNIAGDFSIAGYVYAESVEIPVEMVTGDFIFDCGHANNFPIKYVDIALRECGGSCTLGRFGSAESCSLPNLEKVGKQMDLQGRAECMISMPQLRSIGENIGADESLQSLIYVYNGNQDDGKTLCFPKLEIVNTPLEFRTYLTANCLYESVSLPCLRKVNGLLQFCTHANNTRYQNNALKSISVPVIEYVEGVSFSWMAELSEVSTFQTLFRTGVINDASKWKIVRCAKLPTYDQRMSDSQ